MGTTPGVTSNVGGDEWAVIDFERLVVDIPWRELAKLWLREVKQPEERQAFLAGYRKILPLQEPSSLLDACLSFQLAQGIYRYVLKVVIGSSVRWR